jgi:hypothetical protein
MFKFPNSLYYLTVTMNSSLFMLMLLSKKYKSRVLSLEYLHDIASIKIRTYKTLSNKTKEIIIPCKNLFLFKSNKFMEYGLNLGVIGTSEVFWLGTEEEGIWHNKQLFEDLLGKCE